MSKSQPRTENQIPISSGYTLDLYCVNQREWELRLRLCAVAD